MATTKKVPAKKSVKPAFKPAASKPAVKTPREPKIGDTGSYVIKGATVRGKVTDVDTRVNGVWLTVERKEGTGKNAVVLTNVIRKQAFTR